MASVVIPVHRGHLTVVDAEDYAGLVGFRWYLTPAGYVQRETSRRDGKKSVLMHRQIINAPAGLLVDHVDGDPLNNTRTNLRLATFSQNGHNTRKTRGSSRFKGVRATTKGAPWAAMIRVAGTTFWLGAYETEEDAARAYDGAALALVGEYAGLNFPGETPTLFVPSSTRRIGRANTSGHVGVSFRKRDSKWIAFISLDKKMFYLGAFSGREEAVAARSSAMRVVAAISTRREEI